MLTRTSLFGALALVGLAGCSAPTTEDASVTGGESNLTERKIVSQTSYVTGASSFNKDEADASLAAACSALGDATRAIAGQKFLDAKCGDGENLVSSGFLLGATVTTRYVVDLEQGTAPAASPTSIVTSKSAFNMGDAYSDLADACAAELTRAKSLFGDRLLGGGCATPKNLVTSGFLMSAPFSAFVLPATGATATIDGAIRAQSSSFNMADGLAAWRDACDAFGKSVAASTGARLVRADCGTPTNLVSQGFLYGSKASLEVASGTAGATPVSSAGAAVFGSSAFNMADALTSWQTACDAQLALAKEVLGDRFLGGACAEPKNAVSSGFLYTSSAPIAVAPAGASKILLEGYAFGSSAFNMADSQDALAKNAADAIRAGVARTGAAHVEGFEISEVKNLVSSGFFFGAKTKILVGVDVADGALPPQSSTTHVKGSSAFNMSDAADSWAQACAAAADKAKADYGDRFLGAACAEPTHNNNVYESDLTTWILP